MLKLAGNGEYWGTEILRKRMEGFSEEVTFDLSVTAKNEASKLRTQGWGGPLCLNFRFHERMNFCCS